MDGRFYRTELMIGSAAQEKLARAEIAVFGLGGVGSFAVEALARSGVGAITVVDFDTIGVSNLNRQIFAVQSTIGRAKAEVAAERIAEINPDCRVQVHRIFFDQQQISTVLATDYDVVIDAIDSFNPKISLIVESRRRGLCLLSAMGAASKLNPALIRVGDLSESVICPFAKRIRKRLRSFGIERGFSVVYSIEPPLMPYDPEEIPPDKQEVTLQRGRPRMVQGSICHIPAIFGLTMAGLAIQHVTGLQEARSAWIPQASAPESETVGD